MPITEIIITLSAYLLGSVSSAIIICKMMGHVDPRNAGSNNPGATNVLRISGLRAGFLTFIADVLKGVLPVLVARYLHFDVIWISTVVVAAFLGHCLPVFFSFNGGKGVATAFGAVTTMNWQIGLILLLVWVLIFVIFRISSLAGIGAALTLPCASWFLTAESFLPMTIMALLMIWRHHENIQKLISGDETSFRK